MPPPQRRSLPVGVIKRGDETYRQGKTGPQQNGAQTDSAAGGRVIDFWFRFVVHGGLLAFGFHIFFGFRCQASGGARMKLRLSGTVKRCSFFS